MVFRLGRRIRLQDDCSTVLFIILSVVICLFYFYWELSPWAPDGYIGHRPQDEILTSIAKPSLFLEAPIPAPCISPTLPPFLPR